MKKSTLRRLVLMLLPIAAVGLATTTNSVMIFDPQTGTTYHSYFELVEMGTFQMAAPMAAILSLVSGVLAAVYLGTKKVGCLKAITWTSFLATCSAVMPVLGKGDVKVLPNVMLPILMLVEAALAYIMVKKPVEGEASKAPRLKNH